MKSNEHARVRFYICFQKHTLAKQSKYDIDMYLQNLSGAGQGVQILPLDTERLFIYSLWCFVET